MTESKNAAASSGVSDERIEDAAIAWHDDETLGDETCPHRQLELAAFQAGARWAIASAAPAPVVPPKQPIVTPLQAFVNRAMGLHREAAQADAWCRSNTLSQEELYRRREASGRADEALRQHLRSAPKWIEQVSRIDADKLQWTDERGVEHSMPVSAAVALLREFWDRWPGGLDEIEASVSSWRSEAIKRGFVFPADARHSACELVRDALGGGVETPSGVLGKEESDRG